MEFPQVRKGVSNFFGNKLNPFEEGNIQCIEPIIMSYKFLVNLLMNYDIKFQYHKNNFIFFVAYFVSSWDQNLIPQNFFKICKTS